MPAPTSATAAIRVLMYHHIGVQERPRHQLGLYCDAAAFRRQMAYLARSPLDVISLDRALAAISGEAPLAAPAVVLTFDDGFEDFREHAWPVLQAHGFPATLFAIAERLGTSADWLSRRSFGNDRIMDAPTLRALAAAGLDVGGHSCTHPRLSQLPPAAGKREIFDCKARLEDVLGRRIRHFAYPFGDYDAATRDAVAAAGFASGLTCIRERAERAANVFEIPREGISYRDGRLRYAYKTRWRHWR